MQNSVDFKPLSNHLKKNSVIINFGFDDFIADNGVCPVDMVLTFNSDTLKVNQDDGSEQSFFDGFTFEFLKIKIKRKKAHVIYRYYPNWHLCEDSLGSYSSRKLSFFVDLRFRKQKEWKLINYVMKDIDKSDLPECNKQKYIELE
jgi:hypothetical protein